MSARARLADPRTGERVPRPIPDNPFT